MSNEHPTRDSMPIEEATVSNLWKTERHHDRMGFVQRSQN
jgi:hypothetical protein